MTAGTSQSGSSGGTVHRPSAGIRRVITASSTSKSSDAPDLPTVQLCDLPTNLTLSDINQMVANAGVGQPLVSEDTCVLSYCICLTKFLFNK